MSDYPVRVDEGMVRDWAEAVLVEWLTGYTSEPDQPQYKIDWLGEDVFQVSGVYPDIDMASKRFLVQVSVTEL